MSRQNENVSGFEGKIRLKGYFWALVSALSYGIIPIFVLPLKTEAMSFDAVLVYRFGFTSIMIGIYFLVRKIKFRVSLKQLLPLAILGLIFSLSSIFFFASYDYVSAGAVSTIFFIYPVFVALIMSIFFKERLTPVAWIAIAVSLAGIFVLNKTMDGISIRAAGLFFVLLSALTYALFIIIMQKSNVKNISSSVLTFYAMGFCAIFFLIKCIIQGDSLVMPSLFTGFKIALFALITTALSCISLALAVHYIGSTLTSIFGAVEPLVAVGVSVAFLHEELSANLIIAVILIISAVMLLILFDRKNAQ
ncbi:MAG: DMT family transporter [Spirochaetaceae bacterium]|nr:DMT family transporter [Spirochaetaceae bacterium]